VLACEKVGIRRPVELARTKKTKKSKLNPFYPKKVKQESSTLRKKETLMHEVYYYSNSETLINHTNSTIWPPPPPPLPAGPGTYGNQDHPELYDDYYLEFDDEPSIILKVGALIWLTFIILCFKRERELEIEREARSGRRRARREERRQIREALERRLDPKRRCKDVEAAIMTVVSNGILFLSNANEKNYLMCPC
jgi:hypothetical protein